MIIRIPVMDMTNGNEGILQYDDNPDQKFIQWGLLDGTEALREKLQKYFSTERKFDIPDNASIDGYEEHSGKPISDIDFFQLSLCGLFRDIDVKLGKALNIRETEE